MDMEEGDWKGSYRRIALPYVKAEESLVEEINKCLLELF